LDDDLDDELRAYFEELVEKKTRALRDPMSARREAQREFGSLDTIKQEVRELRAGAAIEALVTDVRYALRALRRSPGFTMAAVLTLALGIGANTAIFSVVSAMLVEPLPYRDSSRLVFVWSDMTPAGYPRAPLSGPELNDLRERTTLFDGFGAIWANTAALTGDGDPEQLRVGLVSTNFFDVLGVQPALGRTFGEADETPRGPASILLSWPVFQRRYGGDQTIVGRRVLVNGQSMTVIGVMPQSFRLLLPPDAAVPDDMQAWLPFNSQFTRGPRGQQYLRVVGRMQPGVTVDQARTEINSVAGRISHEFSEYGAAGRVFNTVGLQADGVRELRPTLLALFGGVGILLLIACVNVASLLVARAAARSRETALRIALGAGRGRLLRQCLVEGLVLTALGALIGLVVARSALTPILAMRPGSLDRIAAAQIDLRVLAFTGGTALVWGVLLSCAPLVEFLRTDLLIAIQRDGRQIATGVQYRTRALLVVAQIALGVVLAVGAGLMVRSFLKVQALDPGFRSSDTLTFKIAVPGARYRGREVVNAFSRRIQAELSAIPGVASAGAISHLPFDNLPNWGGPYLSAASADDASAPHADLRTVTPGLFETIDATLVEGRYFTEDDDPRSPLVAIVDDLLAQRSWRGQSALGKRIFLDPGSTGHAVVPATVVGVVKHLRMRSLVEALSEQVFLPQRVVNRSPIAFVLKTTLPAAELTPAVRAVVAKLDPQLPIYDAQPFESYLANARATQRFAGLLAVGFAAVALTLACVGVYGVMAYAMSRRRYEFGVRLALGATPGQLVRAVLKQGAQVTAAGIAIGIVGAMVAAQAIRAQLFGITERDVPTYAIAVVVIGVAALVAGWFPARRAATADPLAVLRSD
jgi:predicted permease